ncbi:hypothetical protein [Aestuariivivens sediminis]|uniref:hypothetical protein n=1 Tax=Aestuariivivens sediminis TaxID=2913557 RepID=UPI001F574699|nr:hypothetical protein [Aestuariivivens sediminis]
MHNFLYTLTLIFLFFSCKDLKNTEREIELTTAQKIANAHGFKTWKKVKEISFNFNNDRQWTWHPKTNAVTYTRDTVTIEYNRSKLDSAIIPIDRAFINDKFWLLVPFQLIWDKGITISNPIKTEAPISKLKMNKITVTYPLKGGYTPGDAYDLFYNDHFIIQEWIFRKGNRKEPSLINTFENYHDFNGIKIALDHKNIENNWNLTFTNVRITTTDL